MCMPTLSNLKRANPSLAGPSPYILITILREPSVGLAYRS